MERNYGFVILFIHFKEVDIDLSKSVKIIKL